MLPLTSDWTIRWEHFATELRRHNKSKWERLHSSTIERLSQTISTVLLSYLRGRDLPKIEGFGNWRGSSFWLENERISTPVIISESTSERGPFIGKNKYAGWRRFQYNPYSQNTIFWHERKINVNHYFRCLSILVLANRYISANENTESYWPVLFLPQVLLTDASAG